MGFVLAAAAAACFRRPRCQYVSSSSAGMAVWLWLWQRTISNSSITKLNNNNHYHYHSHSEDYCGKKEEEEEEEKQQQQQQLAAPCLLLSSPSNPQYRYLYEISHGKKKKGNEEEEEEELKLKLKLKMKMKKMLEEHFFIGSSQGYIISVDFAPSPNIHIFNPLTGGKKITTLPPPPPPPLPSSDNRLPEEEEKEKEIEIEMCKVWKTPFVEFVTLDSSFFSIYAGKALLSPSLDTIILLRDRELPLFARINVNQQQQSSNSNSDYSDLFWNQISSDDYCGSSVEAIFHKGRLYTITYYNYLLVYNLDYKNNTLTLANGKHGFPNFSLQNNSVRGRLDQYCSLVESPDGDDLFLVYRGVKHEKNDKEKVARWIACRYYETNSCQVFKLSFNPKLQLNEWLEVKSIGDLAFFVGYRSTSLSIDLASHPQCFPSLKPNSVYFSDSFVAVDNVPDPGFVGDAGVCSLEDGTVHYIELFDGHQQLNWPPPVWYMPPPLLPSAI